MKRKPKNALELGSEVIKLLLPHRQPFAMVDGVTTYTREPALLTAQRHISANEPVFAGHFPNVALWPGAYTIEGLAQTVQLLIVIASLQDALAERGEDPALVLDALRNVHRGYRLQPGYRPERGGADDADGADSGASLRAWLRPVHGQVALLAAVDVKLSQPVFAGQRLDYQAELTHRFQNMMRCDVIARVDGQTVARGTMTGATGFRVPAP